MVDVTRRANGEGSIYRRGDGRWAAAHYVLRPDGGRVRRTVYGRTRKEVGDKLAELVAKTGAGIPLATAGWTVERYAQHWIDHVVAPRLRPSTVSSYRETLRLHIVPVFGRVRLSSLVPTHVRRLLSMKLAAGLSPRSVQIIHGTLPAMLAEAVQEELVSRNVAALVRSPSIQPEEVQPGSPEEASVFLATSSTHRLHALFAAGWRSVCGRVSCWCCNGTTWIWNPGWYGSVAVCSGCRRVWCSGRRRRRGLVGPFRCRRCRFGC